MSWTWYVQTLCSLRFLFHVTLGRDELLKSIRFPKQPRKLPVILSREEVAQFLRSSGRLKSRAMLIWAAGIPKRIGYTKKGAAVFLTDPIEEPLEVIHRSDYYLHVLEAAGIDVKKRNIALHVDKNADVEVGGYAADV